MLLLVFNVSRLDNISFTHVCMLRELVCDMETNTYVMIDKRTIYCGSKMPTV